LSLRGKLDVLLSLALLPIVVIIVALGGIASDTDQATLEAGGYRTLIFTVDDVRTALLDVETGMRGYALSGNAVFLEPYNSGLAAVEAELKTLTSLNLFPREVAALRVSAEAYKVWANNALDDIRGGTGLPANVRTAVFEEGKRRFDELRALMGQLEALAKTSFEQARASAVQGITTMRMLPWAILALVLIVMTLVRAGLMRLIVNPLKLLETSTRSLVSNQEYTPVRVASNDEIGRLQDTLNHTAAALEARTQELQRSNRELEQFAYVASHDLQEPLRMVSSYTQLLAKRYKGKLDEKADIYIHYAVDGANRMGALIQDLLAYSRVGSRRQPLLPVDAGQVVAMVLNSLEVAVRESDAKLHVTALPTVLADAVQLHQLFQNLIGNALKFRREGTQHEVSISARACDGWWQFTVEDNGVGIHPEYFERIFVIFQRLHTRETFSGSGIGLAICKKIVEGHGGRLWVESEPERGSRFHFTLPDVGKAS
jgi:signal transduction histidine kinase